MSTTIRKQAPRPAKPTGRYWKGKAPKGAADLPSSGSEEEEDEGQVPEEEGDIAFAGEQEFLHAASDEEGDQSNEVQKPGKMNVSLKNVNISKEGRVIISGKEVLVGTETQGAFYLPPTLYQHSQYYLELSETEGESDEKTSSQEGSDQSSEYDSESEEEKPRVQFRPVFVPKRGRVTVAEKQNLAEDSEEAIRKKQAEVEQRKKESHDLVAESIRRELLEKEKEEEVIDVDDMDGLDPLAEFDAWRLRELARIKRDKEAEIAREEEREEVERRRALPEEQRMKEDLEHAKKLREEKPKGQQVFLQKYWHKGAFHQDQDILKRHDFTEATESTVDVSLLPGVMQVKNFGKRGRTKYTHLLDQDTTVGSGSLSGTGPVKTGSTGKDGAGCFLCGGPHMKKDCPQNTGPLSGKPGTGPNAAPTGIRNERRSWRDDDDRRTQQAHGTNRRWGERRRSRSRSVDARTGDDKRLHCVTVQASEIECAKVRGRRFSVKDCTGGHVSHKGVKRRNANKSIHIRRSPLLVEMDERLAQSVCPPRRVKVAVVGSGLAGLTAAYLSSTAFQRADIQYGKDGPVEFEVHIFEKAETLGVDSHSVSLTLPGEAGKWRVDVPMRSFRGGYYRQLIAFYTRLGVLFRRSNYSYSFSFLDALPSHHHTEESEKEPVHQAAFAIHPTLIYNGASGRAGISAPTVSKQVYTTLPHRTFQRARAQLAFLFAFAFSMACLVFFFLRLQFLASPWLRGESARELSWAEWTERMTPRGPLARMAELDARWRAFVQDVCVPLFSAVCTAPREDVEEHPAEEFLDYIWKTFLTHHYVVSHGMCDVVARLSSQIPASHIHVGAPATALLPDPHAPGRVVIACGAGDNPALHAGFDHVVLATQANHAAPLVAAYARALEEQQAVGAAACASRLSACLSQFEYRKTVVVNHTDDCLLPANHSDRRDLNLVSSSSSLAGVDGKSAVADTNGLLLPPAYTMATHILPRPTDRAPGVTILQTTNPTIAPRPGSVLSVAHLERALVTRMSKAAVRSLCAEKDDRVNVGALQGAARREHGSSAAGIWVVGSYAHSGIPLLEGCVASAREIVERGILRCEGASVHDSPW
ncbi:splicing factor, Prp19-binding domain-containing protein [Lactarius akahatsu]|uniref:Splicing factor, Prp19-binding domain-containing protein n=1 Tax=Lactarius akahatsu TaxID=416441 RepID=A0AAD4QDV8_9AGAM|nr:splicing factor, Prp19-binding domain-containing protein [Lactarius akahatsu]